LRAKKSPNCEKTVEGESGRKREKTTRKYISSAGGRTEIEGQPQRLDCKMNVQAGCEEKLRTDKSLSLFPLQRKIVT